MLTLHVYPSRRPNRANAELNFRYNITIQKSNDPCINVGTADKLSFVANDRARISVRQKP